MTDKETQALRTELEVKYQDVYDTKEMQEKYAVEGFQAPWVVVKRKSDGAVGSLQFTHMPRFYFNFKKD